MKRSSRRAVPSRVKNPLRDQKSSEKKRGLPPGRTLESTENQLIGLASDLAREQMEEGTASSQVITHFLKLGSSLAKLETEKLKRENELLTAKTEELKSKKRVEDLYSDALDAMRMYTGNRSMPDEDDIAGEEDERYD